MPSTILLMESPDAPRSDWGHNFFKDKTMATIKEKVDKRLNDTFTENLRKYLTGQFPGIKFESYCSLASMRLLTTWDAEDPEVCSEIKKVIVTYEAAYTKAREEIWNA